jgi:diguanylate cyclase (GGDEF)-like protein
MGLSFKRCIEKTQRFEKYLKIKDIDYMKLGIYEESIYENKKGKTGVIQYIIQRDLAFPGRPRTIIFVNVTSLEIQLQEQYKEERVKKDEASYKLVKAEKNMESLNELASQFSKLANVDELTGLSNYRDFIQTFQQALSLTVRVKRPLGLVLFDIDHFKKLNDTYGHEQGNVALRSLARELKTILRDVDKLARYGGEEFVFILNNIEYAALEVFMEKARLKVEQMKVKNLSDPKTPISMTASFGGICIFPDDIPIGCNDITPFLERVDENLYKAKEGGRNCVVSSKYVP